MDIFATPTNNSLDGFFDLNFDYLHDSLESSDTSNESNFFDDLSMGSASRDFGLLEALPVPAASTLYQPNHTRRADSWRPHKINAVPKTQRSVHRMRPEGAAISSTELLSLEGKLKSTESLHLPSASPPQTPPSTPFNRRSRATTPTSKPKRPHRVITNSSRTGSGSSKTMHPSTYYTRQESPLQDWTERFQQFNLRVPDHELPISPPPSSKVPQSEQPTRLTIPASINDFDSFSPHDLTAEHGTSTRPNLVSTTGTYPSVSHTTSQWNHDTSSDFMFSQTEPWGPTVPNPFDPSPYDDNEFATPQPMQSFEAFDSSLSTQGLMIQFDDLAAVGEGFIEPRLTTNPAIEVDETPELAESSRGTTRSHHRRAASTPDLPSTPSRRRRSTRFVSSRTSPRTPKTPKTPKTPRTPKTPTSDEPFGFVNFTPHDSRKILTGVAPSGSSKTKARREREASERQRRLSEAAAKAIRDAGGDFHLEELRREGLFN